MYILRPRKHSSRVCPDHEGTQADPPREHDLMTASDYPRLGHAKEQPVFKSRFTMTPGIPTAALRGGVGLETTVSSPLLWRT